MLKWIYTQLWWKHKNRRWKIKENKTENLKKFWILFHAKESVDKGVEAFRINTVKTKTILLYFPFILLYDVFEMQHNCTERRRKIKIKL